MSNSYFQSAPFGLPLRNRTVSPCRKTQPASRWMNQQVNFSGDTSPMPLLRTLLDRERGGGRSLLTPQLRELYDGDLLFAPASANGPYTVANFVSTLDG